MTDKELLELAAKANGEHIDDWNGDTPVIYFWDGDPQNPERNYRYWNPLEDDGDALRLAVKLKMTLGVGVARSDAGEFSAFDEPCDYAATRRAIVRAAAEVGRIME